MYINFYFKNLEYNNNYYSGIFEAPDNDVICKFRYNRKSKETEIWDNNQPVEDILPLPIYWLDLKLEKNGTLNLNEYKICY